MKSLSVAIGMLLAVGCGGNEAEQQQQANEQAEALANQLGAALNMAAEQAQQAQPAAQQQQAQAPAGESNFGTVSLNPGFVPDPHTATGTSGGATDATSLGTAGCVGYIAGTPDHLFNATAAFSSLRVMAHSTADITLVIQKPDGTYVCNDDSEGTNPLVEAPFAAGVYKIWIGSYEQGTNSPYTLGFSELSDKTPSSLVSG